MVKVYERLCVEAKEIETGHEDDPILRLIPGEVYTVSEELSPGVVAVFTRYWFKSSTDIFGPARDLGYHRKSGIAP